MHRRPASSSFARVILALVVILSGLFVGSDAHAQSPRITHEVIKSNIKRQAMGRDLWFSMAENYELQGGGAGKYYEMYVASPAKTEVRVALGKATEQKFPISAQQVLVFRVPLAWEMLSSGEVEPKAVHVWSENADLSAYLLSRNPATSDGMYIIPSIGWGTEYVVASFHSYAYLPGYELPSEFVLIANQDNTVIEVTPSTDLRQGVSTAVGYPRGKKFTVTLNRGDAVQYQNSAANGQMEGYDVTGTILTGNKPFGVVAGNMCANIPAENPYCDHICDMLPPTRTWATTYYSAPYKDRKGGDAFRIVAKEDNTQIWRRTAAFGKNDSSLFCVLNKNQEYIRHDITDATKWWSDKPFLLVQYCNSTDYPEPGTNNGIGDPQMTIVNSVEQFSPYILFQTPKITTGSAFTNYVNIIVKETAIDQTLYDGKPIRGTLTSLPAIDGYQIFRASNVSPGSHTIESPEGVGAYIYGYGSYDSYGWTASYGTATFQSPDTVAPEVTTPTQCFTARVNAQDIHEDASKLNAIDLDSVYNMSLEVDPAWLPGTGMDKSFYDIAVMDQSKEAYIRVIFYDAAGNTTTVISKYRPQTATIAPPLTDFGVGTAGTDIFQDVTITNTGATDFNLTKLELQFGTRGFRLVEPVDRSPLKPGEERKIKVAFQPVSQQTMGDTVLFGDDCILGKAVVIGNGGAPDFYVTNADIGPIYVGTTAESDDRQPIVKQNEGVRIVNGTKATVIIESITLSNTTDFTFNPALPANVTPITVEPESFHEIIVQYNALAEPGAQTDVTFVAADNVGTKVAIVTGKAIAPGAQIVENTIDTLSCVVSGTERPYEFQIQSTGTASTTIQGVRVTGATGQFSTVQVRDASNNIIDFTTPKILNKNEKWFVYTTFTAPPNVNQTYVLTIEVLGQDGSVIQNGTVVATAVTEFKAYKFNNVANLNIAPVNYGGAPVTATFEVENTTELPVRVDAPIPVMGNPGSHPGSFSITDPPNWPITLAPYAKRAITVQFDPTLSTAEQQTVNYVVSGDACEPQNFSASAGTIVGGFTAQGFPAPQIFSCATSTNDVVVTAGNSPTGEVSWTITGANLDRFTTTLGSPQTMVAGQQLRIPVTFTPSAVSQQASYTANMELTYKNEQGREYTEVVAMNATAGGVVANASSLFALPGNNNEVTTGDEIMLPINMEVTKNVPTIDMTTTGITSARFVYTYNDDLLTVENNNLGTQVRSLAPGWSLDQGASSVTSGRVEVVLTAAPGTEIGATERLAEIRFLVRLADQTSQNDSMRLETFELRDASGQSFSTCASTSAVGSYLNLTYRCGDAVFQQMMNGMTGFSKIEPVTPNPITDQKVVTLRYATRVSTPISIEIVDQLGNVVDEVMTNRDHEAGAFEVKYDVSKLGSGSYVYRFKTAQSTLSQRFVVTK